MILWLNACAMACKHLYKHIYTHEHSLTVTQLGGGEKMGEGEKEG